jgi:hypothetical protein
MSSCSDPSQNTAAPTKAKKHVQVLAEVLKKKKEGVLEARKRSLKKGQVKMHQHNQLLEQNTSLLKLDQPGLDCAVKNCTKGELPIIQPYYPL